MPTASASMRASISVVELMSNTPDAAVMTSTDAPAPTSAVASGSSAAQNEPRVTTRTMIATTTPSASTSDRCGRLIENRSPPTCTVLPGMAACSAAPASSSCSRWASVKVETL